MLGLTPHLQEHLYYPAKPSLDYWGVSHNYIGVLTSLNKVEFRMDIHTVTWDYTQGSCRNSTNPMRHHPRQEMRLDSPALRAEQSHIPNQTRKEPRFYRYNTRESPRKQSQVRWTLMSIQKCKIARCTPKSTRDEAHFPFIAGIAIPCSTAYSTSGLTSYRKLQRFPETTVSSLYEY